MDRTLIICKPDAVQRGLVGEILGRFERKGLTLAAAELRVLDEEILADHYAEHQGKPFYPALVEYMTSGPIMVQVLEGEGAVALNRKLMGATNPSEAEPGTIRADFAESIDANSVHGSDSQQSAEREVAYFFDASEIHPRSGGG